jgi:Cu2+-exporting ATPase
MDQKHNGRKHEHHAEGHQDHHEEPKHKHNKQNGHDHSGHHAMMIQGLLGYKFSILQGADNYILFAMSTIVFFYGDFR